MLVDLQEKVLKDADEQTSKNVSMYILQNFYMAKYSEEIDIYDQLNTRLDTAMKIFAI